MLLRFRIPRLPRLSNTPYFRLHSTKAPRKGKSAASGESSKSHHPSQQLPVSFEDISTATYRVRDGVHLTSCKHSNFLSKTLEMECFLKKDYRQATGSFKERGARNALMMLSPEEASRGVIAASAGNHALALAYHGKSLSIPVTCVMPTIAPLTKISNCRELGATVILAGEHILEARDRANELAEDQGLTYINGFDHPNIIAGAGTMATEILNQVQDIDAIVVPIGGAGLIAGIAVAVKTLNPEIQIIGVEPENCASFTAALNAGSPVDTPNMKATLADGLAVPKVGDNAFSIASTLVDKVVTVSEQSIALAVLRLVELEKVIVEGGGATGVAAVIDGKVPELRGKRVVFPLCGANIDITVLGRVIDRGLAADGRLVRFVATVSDRPGGVARLTELLYKMGGSIKDIYHERAWLQSSVSNVQVKCIVEATSAAHSAEIKEALISAGYPLLWGGEEASEFSADAQSSLAPKSGNSISRTPC